MKIIERINTQTPVDKSIEKTSKILIVITIIWGIFHCLIALLGSIFGRVPQLLPLLEDRRLDMISCSKKTTGCFCILLIIYYILIIFIFVKCYFKFFNLGGILYVFLNIIIFYVFIFAILRDSSIIPRIVFFLSLLINLFVTAGYLVRLYNSEIKIQEQTVHMLTQINI